MNKGMIVLAVLVASMSVGALAVGFMGPPTAELKQGQWNLGYNYTYSDMDLEKTSLKWAWFDVGVFDEGGKWAWFDVGVKTQRHYIAIGYGLADWWEVYAQLGLADVKTKGNAVYDDGDSWKGGINFDNDFAWGLGTRFTFAEQDKVKWGLSAQMNWLDTSWDEKGSEDGEITYLWKDTIDIESFDLLVALGPTVDMGCWKLYGGPFYYYLNGDYDYKSVDNLGWVYKESADLEEDSSFGGFIGAIFPIGNNMDWTTEFSATGDGWAIGTGIGWKF